MVRKISWFLFGFFAVAIGLYPLIYFFVDRTFGLLIHKSDTLLANTAYNIGFYGHIVLGGLALMVGWIQFHTSWRQRHLKRHRQIGMIYMISVLISGLCSLYIAHFSTGGMITALGFISLGVVWLLTTGGAFYFVRQGNIRMHEKLMIYSYAGCFGAVTLRIWLPILIGVTGDFITAYQIVAWLAWVPNLIVAYFITRRI